MSTSSKSTTSCSEDDNELRRGPWTLEEDTLLIHYIAHHGEGRWNLLAKRSGLRRTGKSCRLRWLNYLKPDVKRGNLTLEEQLLILDLHSKWGNRWSKIAQYLPGRTDNEIKNYWRTRVQKQAKHLKIDSKSTAFQDIIRYFWMPRLLQKIEESSPSSSLPIQNSEIPLSLENATSQHSASAYAAQICPPPQLSVQGDHLNADGHINGLNIQEQISDWENCTISCIDSSESMNMSQIAQFSECPQTSPFHVIASNAHNTLGKSCSNVNNGCSIDIYNDANISASGMFENPAGDYHVEHNSWTDSDFLGSMWNTDELWQYRN
ncbi:hypothetical protein FEM48_Zijuj05G0104200 [Ziziphus jujuba var. spinosa]|uniref:Transcription factor MYB62-like n=1 Tax=Ziziphus jujuba var. spinosa TaxID=714518 RepID=A0A978VEF1_ZIZJJ|nr:hypothetical protein FEM48_Zijuj05G0104200 [Ziziphus jujuba var. spinosa]